MFRQIIACMFMVAFVAQTFHKPFVLLDYFANTAAYAKKCVNKARPKMHCNGKCQVMKKLQEEEKKEQQSEERKASSKAEVLSSKSFFAQIQVPFKIQRSNCSQYPSGKVSDISYAIFHPPAV